MTHALRTAPRWLKSAAQGLAFWIGYRRSIYSDHQMSEGALAAELGTLIHAHLPDAMSLRYEQPYTSLLPAKVTSDDLTPQARADISVWEKFVPPGAKRARHRPKYVVELKRASASNARIDQDLRRLAAVAENSEGVRAFLCVASEETRPTRFTNDSGFADKKTHAIPGTSSVYVATNVQKAAFLFNDRDRAHYVLLLEVVERNEA